MRFFMTSFAILLAMVAFGLAQTMAKDPGGGQRRGHPGGGQPSGGQQGTSVAGTHHEAGPNLGRTEGAGRSANLSAGARVNPQFSVAAGAAATPNSWRYRSDNGRWWYWTPQGRWMWYSDDGRWMDYRAATYSNPTNAYVVNRPILA
ncbi:MAG: hypothetical protein ABSG53_06180, partial [Thermoguttaceae bacterium]